MRTSLARRVSICICLRHPSMYRELIILIPSHSLEDFPVHHKGQEADNLLASWTALWHPALIAAAGNGPIWARADNPPAEISERLLAIPDVAVKDLPSGFLQRTKTEGAILLRSGTREELLATALEPVGGGESVDAELAADFMALGFAFLQVQLLTRQMRYASNLDERHFRQVVTEAAKAAVEGNETAAKENLSLCFNLLSQERDHYYSVDVYLLDFTLVASTTLGDSLRGELAGHRPTSVFATGDVIAELATREPLSLDRLRQRIENGQATIVGGEDRELPLQLVDLETILRHLQHGLGQYQTAIGSRPRIFGRRRFGLTPLLPGLLSRLDFHAAVHVTLDDGQFPQGGQFKTRWEGLDGSAIDAISRVPCDSSDHGVFLSLATKLAESMDMDHVASLCFAHWPGQSSRWYDELERVSRYTGALGKFMTLDDYVQNTTSPGRLDRFSAERYRTPYLRQAVIRKQTDPISSVARYWQAKAAERATQTLSALSAIVSGVGADDAEIDKAPASPEDKDVDPRIAKSQGIEAGQRFSQALGCRHQSGRLLLNPHSTSLRVPLELSSDVVASTAAPVVTFEPDDPSRVVVEVPPMGFAWVATTPRATTKSVGRNRKTQIVDEASKILRNEFFEARVHPETGALVSVRSFNSRSNLISQQLAFRFPLRPASGDDSSEDETPYTRMVARNIKTKLSTSMCGEIESDGVLLFPDGHVAADYRQLCRVWRGSRNVELEIHIEPKIELRADPWNCYFACRFAWGDDDAMVFRSLHETRQRVEAGQFEAPQFVEIDDGKMRVAVLTGGLPYHRLVDSRMLDSLLIVRGETQRDFRMAIAVGELHPLPAAAAWLGGNVVVPDACPSATHAGWLLHVGARNLLVTHLAAVVEQGRVVGARARILETAGSAGRTPITAVRPIRSARLLNFVGSSLGDCRIEDGKVSIDLSAFEWIELEARWE